MTQTDASEILLTGTWATVDGKVVADYVCERVYGLIRSQFIRTATDPTRWENLYRDPDDGRFWELTFPHGGWHGGAPRN